MPISRIFLLLLKYISIINYEQKFQKINVHCFYMNSFNHFSLREYLSLVEEIVVVLQVIFSQLECQNDSSGYWKVT